MDIDRAKRAGGSFMLDWNESANIQHGQRIPEGFF